MHRLLHKHTISFKHAVDGLLWAFTTQPNFRVHFVVILLVLIAGFYFQISSLEWIILVFAMVLGISGELVNTAIEAVTDLVTSEWKKEAKIAKDVSAGMMLFIAFGASLIALTIFLPYIIHF